MEPHQEPQPTEQPRRVDEIGIGASSPLDDRDRIVRALNEAIERDFDELFAPDRAA